MDSSDNPHNGAESHEKAEAHVPANPAGLIRTRSGRLVRSNVAARVESGSEARPGLPWLRIGAVAVALACLAGFLAFLADDSPGGSKASLDSILKDVGFVVRQQKGPGITR